MWNHTNTHLFLEKLALFWRESIGLGDEGNDIDFVMQTLHELDIKRLQSEKDSEYNSIASDILDLFCEAALWCEYIII